MSRRGPMRGKRLFWVGMGMNLFGVVLIVLATASAIAHAAGIALVVLGAVLAVRNCRL